MADKDHTSTGVRPPNSAPEERKRTFPRVLASLPPVVDFLQECLTSWGAGETASYVLHLALEELFTNAVKYAGTGAGDVNLSIRRTDGTVTVSLSVDGTESFDPTTARAPDPSLPIDEMRVGGLGLFLTRTMVDTLDYTYADGRSTIIFTKHLEGPHVHDHRQ